VNSRIETLKQALIIAAWAAVAGWPAHADEAPLSVTLTPEQAQARQFGIYFGGTATTFDLCARKGFLAAGDQSAEEIARSILEKMRATATGPDQSAYVQDGWNTMKKEISESESFYTREKCSFIGKEWAKILATMKRK
jgi:hypothetical protein